MTSTVKQGTTISGDRDETLRLINWFSMERVRAANILVAGAGAIGNEVLKNLALLGFGNIYILDRDTIEMSNLTRSVLFRESDCGRSKAEAAAQAVKSINPAVTAWWKYGDVRFDLGVGAIRRMDVVIAGLDNVVARHELNRLCFAANTPWIEAGIDVLDGQVSVYSPTKGACYECYYSDDQYRTIERRCNEIASRMEKEGKVPTTPTIASVVAGVQVQEALKLLDMDSWKDRSLLSRKFSFNGTVGDALIVNLVRRDDCTAHFTVDYELVFEAKELSAKNTTVTELLDFSEDLMKAPVTIELNFDLAVEMPCECEPNRPILQPVQKLFREDLYCPVCGRRGSRRSALVLQNRLYRELTFKYPILGSAKLKDIGVPELDIMRMYAAEGTKPRRSRGKQPRVPGFIELTGDLRPGLGFNRMGSEQS